MRMRVMEFKKEYATEGQEQRERLSHLNKPQVDVTEQRVSVIPEEYGEEPLYERKRPRTLQDRPPTPHVQAGIDNKSEYAVKRLLDSQNLGSRDRPGLHRPVIPTPYVRAGTSAVLQRDSRMTCGYTVKAAGIDPQGSIEPSTDAHETSGGRHRANQSSGN